MSVTDHLSLTSIMRVLLLLTLLVAAPALAQRPDTLRMEPCHPASLPRAVDVSPGTRWIESNVDKMTLADIMAPDDLKELRKIGEVIAMKPLDDFAAHALTIIDSVSNLFLFGELICEEYPAVDCAYEFDQELMGQAYSIARTISRTTDRSIVVMAPLAGSPIDSVPILVTFTTEIRVVVDTLWMIDGAADMLFGSRVGGGRAIPLSIRERRAPWIAETDSAMIARWLDGAAIRNASLHRLPLSEEMRNGFIDLRIRPLERMLGDLLVPELGTIDTRILLVLLDSLDTDTTFTSRTLAAYLERLICSRYSEFDCEYDFDFSDTREPAFADSIRAIIPHYLALPDRLYAVVDDDRIVTFLAFPVDTTYARPVVVTRAEIDEALGVHGGGWHDRLMRSIREEECWAERMEGF